MLVLDGGPYFFGFATGVGRFGWGGGLDGLAAGGLDGLLN